MRRMFRLLCVALISVSCSQSDFASAPAVKGGSLKLEIDPGDVTLNVGSTQNFTATALSAGGKKKIVTNEAEWSVSGLDLASIDKKGLLKAKAVGDLLVTAKYQDATATATVKVVDIDLLQIKVVPEEETIGIGDKVSYKAIGIYADSSEKDITKDVEWKSEKPESAAFSTEEGSQHIATGLQVDEVVVTAQKDDVEGAGKLTINDAKIVKLTVEPLDQTVPVETMVEYKATAFYSDETSRDVSLTSDWSSSAPAVAVFSTDDGMKNMALALAEGATTVSVTYNGLSASTSLTVTEMALASLVVTPETAAISVNGKQQYKAVATFANGSTLDVTKQSVWSVSDETIARISNVIDSSGEATGLSKGSVKVYAEFKETKSNEADLQVNELPPVLFKLTVTKDGTGSGTVSSNPSGISCGATCDKDYTAGTVVTLSAAAAADSTFTGWAGACAGTNVVCTVTLDAAKSAKATFTKKSYALTVTKSGTGTGTVTSNPAGINCGGTCTANYLHGTSVVLTAAPSADSTFTGWTGACSGATPTCTVTVDAAKSANAAFTKIPAPACTITSTYAFYDSRFDRKVSVVFNYSGVVTTATVGGQTSNATGSTHQISAATGTVSGSVTGPGGTGTCSLAVVVTSPTTTFVSGTIENFSQSNGTIGNGTLNFKVTNKDQRLVVISAASKTLSSDFKYNTLTIGTNTAVTGGKYEQSFGIKIRFKYTPDNIVQYNGQIFELTLRDSVTNVTYKLDVPIILRICKQEFISTCNTATPTSQFNGTAGHPGAVGTL